MLPGWTVLDYDVGSMYRLRCWYFQHREFNDHVHEMRGWDFPRRVRCHGMFRVLEGHLPTNIGGCELPRVCRWILHQRGFTTFVHGLHCGQICDRNGKHKLRELRSGRVLGHS